MTDIDDARRVDEAIGFRFATVQDEAAAREGLAVTRKTAECDGLGPAGARYARTYARWRAGLRGARMPNAGSIPGGQVRVIHEIIDRRLSDSGLVPSDTSRGTMTR